MSNKRAMVIGLDGADPVRVKKLISEGRLPNLKKVMEMGVATENLDMLGVFPTVTPPNWTTMATGNWPRTHGVTCFLNHTLGKSLSITEMNWDSRRVQSELIWEAFEDQGKRCILLNYCQAWPNRVPNSQNIIIDGTGVMPFLRSFVDFQKIVYLSKDYTQLKEIPHVVAQGSADCIVYNDQIEKYARADNENAAFMNVSGSANSPMLEQTAQVLMDFSAEEMAGGDGIDKQYCPINNAKNWSIAGADDAKEATLIMNDGLTRRNILLTASDGVTFDTLAFYTNKKSKEPLAQVQAGQWTPIIYDTFNVNDQPTKVHYRIRVMDIAPDGSSAKFYLNNPAKAEDYDYFYPQELGAELFGAVGNMASLAFFDRFTEDGDQVCLEAFELVNDWHIAATDFLFNKYDDWALFYIHLHSIDNINHWFIDHAIPGSHPNWEHNAEVINRIYEINDAYVGAVLKYLDGNTTIFVASDHAAIPRSVGYENPGIGELSGINANVMCQLGYTAVKQMEGKEHAYAIDWTKTKAINHRTSHIYLNLKGRDPEGIVDPADYDDLVQKIISDLYNYRDPKSGDRVVSFAMTREEMECIGMGGDHCGDIFFQLTRDFGFQHANSPNHVTNHGYSLGCLCMMVGAGLKQGEVISRPIRAVDIVPTICHIVGNRMPKQVEGGIIYQALAD